MIIEKIINHDGKKYPMNIVHFPRNEIDTYSYCDREKIRKILFDCGCWGADISSFFLVFFKPCENWNIQTSMSLYQKLSDHSNLFHNPLKMINEIKQFQYLKYKIPDTSDEFIQYAKPFIDGTGFYEYEIARKVEEFGHVVHVWSTFESKYSKEDEKPYTRGINSIQLLNDQKRWWVMNIYWNKETEEFPLPEKYCN